MSGWHFYFVESAPGEATIGGMVINLIVGAVAFVAGAVFSYLFLRANAHKKAVLDAEVNKISQKL